jgi:predicted Zn-ribbon and HTH transcriptional regulator
VAIGDGHTHRRRPAQGCIDLHQAVTAHTPRRGENEMNLIETSDGASVEDMLDQMAELAKGLHYRLEVQEERCAQCGQHTIPAKSAYQAQKQILSIVRQVERLAVTAGRLPWRGEQ